MRAINLVCASECLIGNLKSRNVVGAAIILNLRRCKWEGAIGIGISAERVARKHTLAIIINQH